MDMSDKEETMSERKWNGWPVVRNTYGHAAWVDISYATFERWAAARWTGDNKIVDPALAESFADALAGLAEAERRLIPLDTRADCVALAKVYIERWNERKEA
jgi:hypothetical protein